MDVNKEAIYFPKSHPSSKSLKLKKMINLEEIKQKLKDKFSKEDNILYPYWFAEKKLMKYLEKSTPNHPIMMILKNSARNVMEEDILWAGKIYAEN